MQRGRRLRRQLALLTVRRAHAPSSPPCAVPSAAVDAFAPALRALSSYESQAPMTTNGAPHVTLLYLGGTVV